MPRKVTVAFQVDDSLESVAQLLRLLDEVSLQPGEHQIIDCSSATYLGPYAAALLYSQWLLGQQRGCKVTVKLPLQSPRLRGFCRYSGMTHIFAAGEQPNPGHSASETIPLQRFVDPNPLLGVPVVNLIRRHMALDGDTEIGLLMCLGEAAYNVSDHAQSPIGGVLCGRFLHNKKRIRIAIVDRGLGILTTLARSHQDLRTDRQAIDRVLKGNSTSKSTDRNLGLGIKNIADVVRHLQGEAIIASGSAAVRIHEGRATWREGFAFSGVGLFFSLPVPEPGTA